MLVAPPVRWCAHGVNGAPVKPPLTPPVVLAAIASTKSTVLGLRLDHDRRAWVESTAAAQGVSVRAVFEAMIDRARTEEQGGAVELDEWGADEWDNGDEGFVIGEASGAANAPGPGGVGPGGFGAGGGARGFGAGGFGPGAGSGAGAAYGAAHAGAGHAGGGYAGTGYAGAGHEAGARPSVPPGLSMLSVAQGCALSGQLFGAALALVGALLESTGNYARENWRIVTSSLQHAPMNQSGFRDQRGRDAGFAGSWREAERERSQYDEFGEDPERY